MTWEIIVAGQALDGVSGSREPQNKGQSSDESVQGQ